MTTSAAFLGPVSELPPEGADVELANTSEVDFCVSLLSESGIGFDVSRDGVVVQSNPHRAEIFQRFEVSLDGDNGEPKIRWSDDALEIRLQNLFPTPSAFAALSDASEPEDYVRRFLEVLASSLDDPLIGHEGATVPLIRWRPGERGDSARVQLLGLLLTDDEQFGRFRSRENGDLGLIFEDAEVQAHGVRETVSVLALLGVSLGAVPEAEAGLFKKWKQKKEARMEQEARQEALRRAPAPVQQQQAQRTGWQDAHGDAYINHDLLAAFEDADKRIVVDVGSQRAYLVVNDTVAIDTAISTARADKHTPRGTFRITERVQTGKTSTIYGCPMPYWQRLDGSAIGMHVGDLPGYPASAGCIRLPHSVAPVLFENTASGVTVEVVDHWDPGQLRQNAENMLVAQVVPERHDS
ncbi:MAG: L,D-transpeptidase [Verrucomicrobiales bacterium]